MSEQEFKVREAVCGDASKVVDMVRRLVSELRNDPEAELSDRADIVAAAIIEGKLNGQIFISEDEEGEAIGMASISVPSAVHMGGRYALIQELWVDPEYRGNKVGRALIEAVEEHCRLFCIGETEVCLPGESFAGYENTYAFYNKVGFLKTGLRMRKEVTDY